MLSVASPITRQHVRVLVDIWVMLSSTVYQSQIQRQNRVIQTPVELIMCAMCMETMLLYVIHVLDQIHTIIRNVVLNVYPTQIVRSIKPASETNVKIRVLEFVEVSFVLAFFHYYVAILNA